MTKRYTGGVVSSSLPTVNAAGASGVFLLSQQSDYQSRNAWPPYKVEESLRFRSSAGAYLNRTPSVTGSQTTWTWSAWVKRGTLGTTNILFNAGDGSSNNFGAMQFRSEDTLQFAQINGGTYNVQVYTTAVFRDPSAWYHVVLVYDSSNATSTDRIQIYVNGTRQTALTYATGPFAQNTSSKINSALTHYISKLDYASLYYDGYMSEVNFVDGQALTPSSFGATDKDGNWSPIAYTGTYGTNGFYLNFSNNTSATTMGLDSSGNGNNWTLNGFNVSTANTTYDIMIDVPEDQSDGTANNRGSYCTLNPLANPGIGTLSDGNLQLVTSTNSRIITGTMALPSTGQYYFEVTATDYITDGGTTFGVVNQAFSTGAPSNGTWLGISTYNASYSNGTTTDTNNLTGTNVTNDGDIWCFAIDVTNNKFWVGRSRSGTLVWADGVTPAVNGSGATTISLPSGDLYPMAYRGGSYNETYNFNFGQRPFAYAPPSGFKTLNTFNLPEPTIKQPNQYFDVNLWTGNATNRAITNAGGFQPDFVWIKHRSSAENHNLYDGIRGPGNRLESNDTSPDFYYSDRITAFNSNGFNLGTGYNNTNGTTYVGWQWRGSSANATNTSGSITSIVRANPTSGFSVLTYTGTGSNATIGHGLGATPSMVTVKCRNTSGESWHTYHVGLSSLSNTVYLNGFSAEISFATCFNSMSTLNSTVFSLGTDGASNGSGRTYVAYCFAPVAGYSAFGKYTGNGSTDGPFIYTGFRPKFVLLKSNSAATDWYIYDTARDTYNLATLELNSNLVAAEQNNVYGSMDILSNGFKLRFATGEVNASGATYIYACFAEAPFKYARSR